MEPDEEELKWDDEVEDFGVEYIREKLNYDSVNFEKKQWLGGVKGKVILWTNLCTQCFRTLTR